MQNSELSDHLFGEVVSVQNSYVWYISNKDMLKRFRFVCSLQWLSLQILLCAISLIKIHLKSTSTIW